MDKTPRTLMRGVQKTGVPAKKEEPKDAIKGFVGAGSKPPGVVGGRPAPPATLTKSHSKDIGTPALVSKPLTPSAKKRFESSSTVGVNDEKSSFSLLDSFLIWLNMFLFAGIVVTVAAVVLFILALNKVDG